MKRPERDGSSEHWRSCEDRDQTQQPTISNSESKSSERIEGILKKAAM